MEDAVKVGINYLTYAWLDILAADAGHLVNRLSQTGYTLGSIRTFGQFPQIHRQKKVSRGAPSQRGYPAL